MYIDNIKEGKEYILTHAYGQPNQRVKVLNIKKENHPRLGRFTEVDIIYTSFDATQGRRTSLNEIECERYLYELTG